MINIIIYGSCVARDTVTMMGDCTRVGRYIARQGMLSAALGPASLKGKVQLDSAFQTRSVEMDIAGNALNQLEAAADKAELVLLDLMDERLGAYRTLGGAFITRTWELLNSGILEQQPKPLSFLEFGSDKHFDLWQASAEAVIKQIRAFEHPIILLAPPLADHDLEGNPLDYMGKPVADWNTAFDRYYDAIEQLGVTVLRPPAELAVADKDHKWGLAPFHYAKPMYEWFKAEIERAIAEPSESAS